MAQQTINLDDSKSLDAYILFRHSSLSVINTSINTFITDVTTKYTNVKILTPDNWFSAPNESFIINIGVNGSNVVPTDIYKYCSNYQFGAQQTIRSDANYISITIKVY